MISEELNISTIPGSEVARALHRVVRAMHDGHCPACGHLGPSEAFYMHPTSMLGGYHLCPNCGFKITDGESEEALKSFHAYMRKNLEIFLAWRADRKQFQQVASIYQGEA